jgi:hypothetical protein
MSTAGPLTTARPITVTSSGTSIRLSPGTSQHPSNFPSPTNGALWIRITITDSVCSTGAYPIPSFSIQFASREFGALSLGQRGPGPNAGWGADWNGPLGVSAGDLSYTSEFNDGSDTDVITGQSPYPDRDLVRMLDIGNTGVHSVQSFYYPPSIGPRWSRGCSNPAFPNSITNLEGGYCSREHQG